MLQCINNQNCCHYFTRARNSALKYCSILFLCYFIVKENFCVWIFLNFIIWTLLDDRRTSTCVDENLCMYRFGDNTNIQILIKHYVTALKSSLAVLFCVQYCGIFFFVRGQFLWIYLDASDFKNLVWSRMLSRWEDYPRILGKLSHREF